MSVRTFLEAHGLSAHIAAFEANHVTMEDLPSISDVELRDTFGMTVYGDRRKFRAAVAQLAGVHVGVVGENAIQPTRRGAWGWTPFGVFFIFIFCVLSLLVVGMFVENMFIQQKEVFEEDRVQAAAKLAHAEAEASRVSQRWTSPTLGVMQWIPPGSFKRYLVGKDGSDRGTQTVSLSRGFWMMEHEVTQEEWSTVMGTGVAVAGSPCPTCPMDSVTWEDAQAFARLASERDGVTYALPTVAQWSYGLERDLSYSRQSRLSTNAWSALTANGRSHPVCGRPREGYDLCDMSGNVSEWTNDYHQAPEVVPAGDLVDPVGAIEGEYRAVCGHSWQGPGGISGLRPDLYCADVGFRLVRTPP